MILLDLKVSELFFRSQSYPVKILILLFQIIFFRGWLCADTKFYNVLCICIFQFPPPLKNRMYSLFKHFKISSFFGNFINIFLLFLSNSFLVCFGKTANKKTLLYENKKYLFDLKLFLYILQIS